MALRAIEMHNALKRWDLTIKVRRLMNVTILPCVLCVIFADIYACTNGKWCDDKSLLKFSSFWHLWHWEQNGMLCFFVTDVVSFNWSHFLQVIQTFEFIVVQHVNIVVAKIYLSLHSKINLGTAPVMLVAETKLSLNFGISFSIHIG